MALTLEQEEELQEILDHIVAHRSEIKGKEIEFVDDMVKRFEEYGSETFVSPKQFSWLRNIKNRIG